MSYSLTWLDVLATEFSQTHDVISRHVRAKLVKSGWNTNLPSNIK